VYKPGRIADGQPPHPVALAALGRNGRLVIYAGAGLSRAKPTELPSGPEVASRTYQRLAQLLAAIPACDEGDLTSVADAVGSLAGGLRALRETVVRVVEFTTATPNYGHQALALLLLEGVVKVLTTNWDDCIERGGQPERVQVTITAVERGQMDHGALLKVHGCATRPDTLLITTAEVDEPEEWIIHEMGARLADSHVVFVGIGDVAAYVRDRLSETVAAVGDSDHVLIVSPTVAADWATSEWARIVPDLPAENRIEMAADEFLDMLAGAYVHAFLAEVAAAVEEDDKLRLALARVREPLEQLCSVAALTWLRSTAVPRDPGVPVLSGDAIVTALVALGILAAASLTIEKGGAAMTPTGRLQVLVAVGTTPAPASRFRREAENRLADFLSQGGKESERPQFLVACPLPLTPALVGLPVDLMGDTATNDVLGGPLATTPVLIDAAEVLRR
jgi:hypothetical protein